MEPSKQVAVGRVELGHLQPHRAAAGIIRRARIVPHRVDRVPIDDERLAAGAGLRRVASAVGAARQDFVVSEVVRDRLVLRVEHVARAIPHLRVLQALALLFDLVDRLERRCQVVYRDDAAAPAIHEVLRGELAHGVTREDLRLAKGGAECCDARLDRLVELPNGVVAVVLRWRVRSLGPLDAHERLDRRGRQPCERHQERVGAVWQVSRIARDEVRLVQDRCPANGVQQICC